MTYCVPGPDIEGLPHVPSNQSCDCDESCTVCNRSICEKCSITSIYHRSEIYKYKCRSCVYDQNEIPSISIRILSELLEVKQMLSSLKS